MATQQKLLNKLAQGSRVGHIEWIGLRPGKREPLQIVERAELKAGCGLIGDHKGAKDNGSARQITLIMREHIELVEQLLDRSIEYDLLRRNIVVSKINLNVLRHQTLGLGSAVIQIGAHCHPCSRMDQALGEGAISALFGHAGYCASVVSDGEIALGDSLALLNRPMFN